MEYLILFHVGLNRLRTMERGEGWEGREEVLKEIHGEERKEEIEEEQEEES